MWQFIFRRTLYMIPVMIVVSILSFLIIRLPPGDFLSSRIMELKLQGTEASESLIAVLRQQYGLDEPGYVQYFKWVGRLLHGDMGMSFQYNRPVVALIGERMGLTMALSLLAILLTWIIAIPIGIYSATHQYSLLDYLFTFFGFIGLAIPGFLIALILMYFCFTHFGFTLTGLCSPEYVGQPLSVGKMGNIFLHVMFPALIIAAPGTASMIRIMRGCLLDELRKQYVTTALAKGLSRRKLVFKYPVRVAINPLLSTMGWILPAIVSGETIISIILNLPTTGPMLFQSLKSQDMFLASSIILLLSGLTVIGTLISDILLAWSDPRIRYEKVGA